MYVQQWQLPIWDSWRIAGFYVVVSQPLRQFKLNFLCHFLAKTTNIDFLLIGRFMKSPSQGHSATLVDVDGFSPNFKVAAVVKLVYHVMPSSLFNFEYARDSTKLGALARKVCTAVFKRSLPVICTRRATFSNALQTCGGWSCP